MIVLKSEVCASWDFHLEGHIIGNRLDALPFCHCDHPIYAGIRMEAILGMAAETRIKLQTQTKKKLRANLTMPT